MSQTIDRSGAQLNMRMMRGDTLTFYVARTDIDISAISDVIMTVRKTAHTEILVQKTLGNGITPTDDGRYFVRIAPEDTADMLGGRYVYDVEFTVGSEVSTPVHGVLELVQDVTY